jgi:hypothetical protein
MLHLGAAFGVLAAFDRGIERAPFTEGDEKLLQNFAATAANAEAIAKSIDPDRLHTSPAARDNGRQKPAHAPVEENAADPPRCPGDVLDGAAALRPRSL